MDGSPPKIYYFFLGPQATYVQNFMKTLSILEISCSQTQTKSQTDKQGRKHNLLDGGNEQKFGASNLITIPPCLV